MSFSTDPTTMLSHQLAPLKLKPTQIFWLPWLLALLLWSWGCVTHAGVLNSPGPFENSNEGIMFDLQTNQSIVVTGLSTAVKQASPNATFEIWGRSGSHVNAEDSSHAGWVQLGSAGPIAVEEESVVSLPTTLNLRLAAGATHALLVLRTDEENNVSYAEASGNRGDVVASNAHLKILSGSSVGLDFDAPSTSWEFSNSPRNFIGEVRYSAQPAELRAVPTLSAWALTLLGLLAAGLGLRSKRRLA